MNIPQTTISKMADAHHPKRKRRLWQFSLVMLFALVTTACAAAYAARPYMPDIVRWMFRTDVSEIVSPPPHLQGDPCPGCGMG